MQTMFRFGGCLAAVLIATGTFAHHSIGGEFSEQQVTVEGVVTEFALINPHAYIVLEVEDGTRRAQWTLTMGPATKLIRGSGWTPATLEAGDRVTATGRVARSGNGMYISELVAADGTKLIASLQE